MHPVRAPDAPGVDGTGPDPAEACDDPPDAVGHRGRSWRAPKGGSRAAVSIVGLVALLCVPLVVALAVLASPRWYPVLDMAQTELRVRDVGTVETPLIGLAGRIGPLGEQGSHPGPLSFVALSPFYRLFGASPWAMQVAGACLHVLAMGAILWIARRRGGAPLLVGVAAVLAILLRAYGASTLTEPWNPYLPVLWWLVFLLAVWSVTCGDLALLPLAVFAGSFCMQTHLPYLGPVAGLALLIVVTLALWGWSCRHDRAKVRRLARWGLAAGALGIVLWAPPLLDELTRARGNLTRLWDHFGTPDEASIGLRGGVELLLAHLNPGRLLSKDLIPSRFASPSVVPGALMLSAWAASAVIARRLGQRSLLRLHLVVGVALVLAAVTLSRIFGYVWYYLSFWVWGITALVLLCVGWTAGVVANRRLDGATVRRAGVAGFGALSTLAVVSTALFAMDATDVEVSDAGQSKLLAELAPPTVAALHAGSVPGGGRDGRYLVSWEVDPIAIGSQGFGLLNELERRGFDVGAPLFHNAGATRHRVLAPENADAVVHVAVGSDIEVWRAKPEAEQVAYSEPRDPQERAEYERLREEVADGLRSAGLTDLVATAERVPFIAALDPRLSRSLHDKLLRMLDLGLPAAVFVAPPDAIG